MNTIRHKWIILFFRILGWVNISASIIVLLSLLGGGSGIRFFLPLELSAYTLIIISGVLGGLLLLGFAALLEHQADLVELQLKQTELLEKLSANIVPEKHKDSNEDLLNMLKQQNNVKIKEIYVDEDGNFIDKP